MQTILKNLKSKISWNDGYNDLISSKFPFLDITISYLGNKDKHFNSRISINNKRHQLESRVTGYLKDNSTHQRLSALIQLNSKIDKKDFALLKESFKEFNKLFEKCLNELKSKKGEITKNDWYILLLIWGDNKNIEYEEYLSFKELTEILPQFTMIELDGNLKEFERMPIPKEWIEQKTFENTLESLIIYGFRDNDGNSTKLTHLDQINKMFESDKINCSELSIDYFGELKIRANQIHIEVQKNF